MAAIRKARPHDQVGRAGEDRSKQRLELGGVVLAVAIDLDSDTPSGLLPRCRD
jgi:hypothetical protein